MESTEVGQEAHDKTERDGERIEQAKKQHVLAHLPRSSLIILPISIQSHWASFMSWDIPSCVLPWALAQTVLSIWSRLPLSTSLTLYTFTLNVTFPERTFLGMKYE